MVIWRGWGILAVIILGISVVAARTFTESLLGPGYWESNGWPMACALVVAGILIWLLDAVLATSGGRVLVDENTGKRVVLRKKHDVFFIPLQWWGIICVGFAVLIMIKGTPPGKNIPVTPDHEFSSLR